MLFQKIPFYKDLEEYEEAQDEERVKRGKATSTSTLVTPSTSTSKASGKTTAKSSNRDKAKDKAKDRKKSTSSHSHKVHVHGLEVISD